MEILKGLVKDQGYPDTTCSYASNGENTYYFVDGGTLSNGNIIASTVLKEAIKHAKDTSLGVIDKDGNVIIPFENKTIRVIGDKQDKLLVVRNKPLAESVIAALKDMHNPLEATRLVTTAATLKNKVFAENDSMPLYNDIAGEAAVYDIDGKNLTGEYYSFIGMIDGKSLYCTHNTMDSSVVAIDLTDSKEKIMDGDAKQELSRLDITTPEIDAVAVNKSIEDEMAKQEVVPIPVHDEQAVDNSQINQGVPAVNEVGQEQIVMPEAAQEKDLDVVSNDSLPEEETMEKVEEAEDSKPFSEIKVNPIAVAVNDESKVAAVSNEEIQNTLDAIPITPNVESKALDDEKKYQDEQKNKIVNFADFLGRTKEDNKEIDKPAFDIEDNGPDKALVNDFYEPDSVLEDAANAMKELIDRSKQLKNENDAQERTIEALKKTNDQLNDVCDSQSKKIDSLDNDNRILEANVSRLEARCRSLEGQVDELREDNEVKARKIEILEPQIAGKKKLVELLGEARGVLTDNDGYDNEAYSKRLVA